MIVGVMQPYFVPYIGYWQLMKAVDKFVVFDDVNYIRGGWINRNRILFDHQPKYFNIPMCGASQNKLINEIMVDNNQKIIIKNLRLIETAYRKAPFYKEVYPLIDQIVNCGKTNISDYIINSFGIICNYLDIKTELIVSSSLNKNCSLKAQDKILEICKLLNATKYYNAIGGKELYSFDEFSKNDISLKFLQTANIKYEQFGSEFQPNLSIVDAMMFNDVEHIQKMLLEYSLIGKEES